MIDIIIRPRSAKLSLVLLLVQQIIVASSTLWIARLVGDVANGRPFAVDLTLFLLSLVLPYLPGVLSLIMLECWRQDARQAFLEAFVKANLGAVGAWGDPRERHVRTAFLAQEAGTTLFETIAVVYDV